MSAEHIDGHSYFDLFVPFQFINELLDRRPPATLLEVDNSPIHALELYKIYLVQAIKQCRIGIASTSASPHRP